ncbi:MAG: YjjG family noncanonical pyrimidine nucleotidase [Anaerolineales bacterium]
MTRYKHILFDLDHTLWDFNRNSMETLVELFDFYDLGRFNKFSSQDFTNKFREVNTILWDLYDRNEIDRYYIRAFRFQMILKQLGLKEEDIPPDISEVYLKICPTKGNVVPDTFEVLDYLKGQYKMHIITNGFDDIQDTKLNSSNLRGYFDKIFTSEAVGFKKPSKEMFEKAVEWIGTDKKACVMVGDNIETDIKGAINASLDVIFFNPDKILHELPVTYEITSLLELKNIL